MCIVILSNTHPEYSLILLNNRDEFLHRPTAPANWWADSMDHVLAPQDLLRAEHGTWLGITKDGRVAALTNFYQSEGQVNVCGRTSRGAIISSFLSPATNYVTTERFISSLFADHGTDSIGGFNLLCGRINEPLYIVSNRDDHPGDAAKVLPSNPTIITLSNLAFGDRTWPKVTQGEKLLAMALQDSITAKETEEELKNRLFSLLSTDDLPKWESDGEWITTIEKLQRSIFIPKVTFRHKGMNATHSSDVQDTLIPEGIKTYASALTGPYGTLEQTIIMVHKSGLVKYFERTLYDSTATQIPTGKRERDFEFQLRE